MDVAAFRMRRVTLSRRMERRAGRLAHCGAAPLMRNGLDSHAAVLGTHAGGAAAADASLTPSASVQSSVRFVLAGSRLAGVWPCRRARRPGSGRYPSQLPSGVDGISFTVHPMGAQHPSDLHPTDRIYLTQTLAKRTGLFSLRPLVDL